MRYYFLALGTVVVVCVGCVFDGGQLHDKGEFHAPPAAMMTQPGPMVAGPGPGVIPPLAPQPQPGPMMGPMMGPPKTSQVKFIGFPGMQVGWLIPGGYAENQITAPGRYNFIQGATFRLKLTNVPGREGLVVYPTLQVYPAHPQTDAYLSHNNIPIDLTDEDLDQVESNNFVTKVIYLPDPRYQELAIAGVETLVSTRLDPGVDPVAEAERRGTIMAVLRMGNMDLEMPGHRPAFPPGLAPPGFRGPAGDAEAMMMGPDGVQPVAYRFDGDKGQHAPPLPIALHPPGMPGVPHPTIVGGSGGPGLPPPHPVAGMGTVPVWGMPITSTPIGLPGPPHLPFGGPAGLKSHTVRNHTEVDVGEPVDHFLLDVKHSPGIRMPHPVKHVQYSEKHPVHRPGEASYPAWAQQGGLPQPGMGPYGPPPPMQPAPVYAQ